MIKVNQETNYTPAIQEILYKKVYSEGIRRLLSLLDRDLGSLTYGCFDRQYWHYRIVSDFASAVYQNGVLALALVYKNRCSEDNFCYKNKKIAEYITAALRFWVRIQNKDGSFNEWYPNEHSFVATAFTAYAVSETMLILKDEIPPDIKSEIQEALNKAGDWLNRHTDTMIANHTAGAIPALYNIYLLSRQERFLDAVKKNIEIMQGCQDTEGWFCEYGGADAGYLGVSIDYLAKYYKRSNDSFILPMIERALGFMIYFLHPDGTFGGSCGSRNTSYILPHGLEVLSDRYSSARHILNRFYDGLGKGKMIDISDIDDRYFVFFFIGNYIQADIERQINSRKSITPVVKNNDYQANLNIPASFERVFKRSGLFISKTSDYYVVGNFKKNAILWIYTDGRLIYSDSGYFGLLDNNNVVSSQWQNQNIKDVMVRVEEGEDFDLSIDVSCHFIYIRPVYLSSNLLIPFRLCNYFLCRSDFIAKFFHRWIKNSVIIKNKRAPFSLRREIRIGKGRIIIKDDVSRNTSILCRKFSIEPFSTTLYSPTSKYFRPVELNNNCDELDIAGVLNKQRQCSLHREFRFNKNGVILIRRLGSQTTERQVFQRYA